MKKIHFHIGILVMLLFHFAGLRATNPVAGKPNLTPQVKNLILIAAHTAQGNLDRLQPALHKGLDAGLTVHQIKEALVHLYAYAGFPRSIRGLQTFMTVLDQRKAKGIQDSIGPGVSPIKSEGSKYDRGKAILDDLLGTPQNGVRTGYAAFAPEIEIFLKEHLFADLFERDILTYTEREWVTVSVLSSIGGVEPMLQSHFKICRNLGVSAGQLQEFVHLIDANIGKKQGGEAQKVLNGILKP